MNWRNILFGEKRNFVKPEDPGLACGGVLEWLGLGMLGPLNISTFFRGTCLISNSIAQLPILTKKKDGKGASNVLKNHPTMMLWSDRTNLVDSVTMLRNIVQNVINKGNAFIYVKRADDGTPVALRYLPTPDVNITYVKERGDVSYTCSYIDKGRPIKKEDMLHFKLFTWDGINGISVINFAKHQTELTNTTDAQAKSFFDKGCSNISGVLTVNSTLSEKQRLQILNTWNQTYTNGRAGLAVLQGNMNYTPIQIKPDEAQLLESREFNQADVCQFLNLNPAQLGLKGFTQYSSFEDANNDLLQRTLMPYIRMIESEMSRKLLNDSEKNVKIVLDTAAFLRPNKQSESQYYSSLIDKGVLSRNEVRQILGYGKVEGLDDYIIPFTDIAQNTINNNDNNGEGAKEL